MAWYTNVLLVPLFIFLACIHLIYNDPNIITSSVGLFISVSALLIQIKTKDHQYIVIGLVVLGSILCQISIYIIVDSQPISDLIWIMLISFYSFYLLGSKWGGVVILTNILGLLLHLGFFPDYTLTNQHSDHSINLKTVINIGIVTIVIFFIIYRIITSSEKANKELQNANILLQAQNEEKTVLLREIHHRVKNNLQLISSLLRLQSQDINDEEIEVHFNEAIDRIKSMSLIHEKMYQQNELAKLDLEEYLNSLVEDILSSHHSQNTVIKTVVKSELTQLNIEKLVPLALLFNELIVNSIKHAFKEQDKGEITLSVLKNDHDVVITYSDNGKWHNPTKEISFGTELIETLCQQLDATCVKTTENGTSYRITCNLED